MKRMITSVTLALVAAVPMTASAASTHRAVAPSAASRSAQVATATGTPTRAMVNARRTAHDYLDTEAFSRKSLMGQLKFEGYTTAQIAYGVNFWVDWNKQAAKSAEEYLDTQAFSRSGLIEQLKFEGFTTAQATYGVNKAGL